MAKKRKKNAVRPALPGVGEVPGADFDPARLPEDETADTAAEGGEVPLGLPISPEEYKRLQKQARHLKPPSTGSAQEDPAAGSEDG